jgi:hypothetical protein
MNKNGKLRFANSETLRRPSVVLPLEETSTRPLDSTPPPFAPCMKKFVPKFHNLEKKPSKENKTL